MENVTFIYGIRAKGRKEGEKYVEWGEMLSISLWNVESDSKWQQRWRGNWNIDAKKWIKILVQVLPFTFFSSPFPTSSRWQYLQPVSGWGLDWLCCFLNICKHNLSLCPLPSLIQCRSWYSIAYAKPVSWICRVDLERRKNRIKNDEINLPEKLRRWWWIPGILIMNFGFNRTIHDVFIALRLGVFTCVTRWGWGRVHFALVTQKQFTWLQ